jgi:antitoxin component YwqK of YwqJK toxin-antitoxin module
MSENKLKVCSSNYNDGIKEFTGTYLDSIIDGKYNKLRVGVWKFWYPNGKMKFEGIYKKGTLVSKKCWDPNGESIVCDLIEMTDLERYRIFKEK